MTAVIGNGAKSLRVNGLLLTNCGGRAYTVRGYPVVELLDSGEETFPVEVSYGRSELTASSDLHGPPRQIVLQPGETATSGFFWHRPGAPPGASYVRAAVLAGRETQTVALRVPLDVVDGGELAVGPWIKTEP